MCTWWRSPPRTPCGYCSRSSLPPRQTKSSSRFRPLMGYASTPARSGSHSATSEPRRADACRSCWSMGARGTTARCPVSPPCWAGRARRSHPICRVSVVPTAIPRRIPPGPTRPTCWNCSTASEFRRHIWWGSAWAAESCSKWRLVPLGESRPSRCSRPSVRRSTNCWEIMPSTTPSTDYSWPGCGCSTKEYPTSAPSTAGC